MELKGMEEVIRNLDRIPAAAMPVIEGAFDLGLRKVQEHARANHPPWPDKLFNPDGTWRYHNITTNLTNSIGLRMRRVGDAVEGEVGVLNETVVGSAMEYASKMERDHPFIGPAVEAKKDAWLKHIAEALRIFLR